MSIQLRVWIDPKAAIMAGKSTIKESSITLASILDEVRDTIFEELDSTYTRYRRLTTEDVCTCDCIDNVNFLVSTEEGTELTPDQYAVFDEIRKEAPSKAVVSVRRHWGGCPNCNCTPMERYTAYVLVDWNGTGLCREYLLGKDS